MTAATPHNAYQRTYFKRKGRGNVRLEPTESPYVQRHLNHTLRALALKPEATILEVGAGLGRFTSLLLGRKLAVTACDLSPELLAHLVERHPGVATLACDVAEVAERTPARFDAVVGFFMLHHLSDLDGVFRGLSRVLLPGGRVAFCEPNAYHLPYYLQIALSRHMTFRGDGGVFNMRPGVVSRSLERAGFTDVRVERYGFAPPFVYNRASGRALDHALEALPLLERVRAFQIFSASVP
ncbi:MAG TPA: class I SAM-dependent methyltransferase [Polyangiaceae bacterium]|nr:class I SAM-dependent methyltransferase [Polyangiaceae bacterium]